MLIWSSKREPFIRVKRPSMTDKIIDVLAVCFYGTVLTGSGVVLMAVAVTALP
jgi:hypothetical protein